MGFHRVKKIFFFILMFYCSVTDVPFFLFVPLHPACPQLPQSIPTPLSMSIGPSCMLFGQPPHLLRIFFPKIYSVEMVLKIQMWNTWIIYQSNKSCIWMYDHRTFRGYFMVVQILILCAIILYYNEYLLYTRQCTILYLSLKQMLYNSIWYVLRN